MEVFKRMFTLEIKLFVKRYYLIIPLLLTFFYMFYGYYVMQDELDRFSFIRTSGFVMMVLTMLAMCYGVINARQEKNEKFDELINTLPAFWIRQISKVFAWSFCSFVYCIILIMLCTGWIANGGNELWKYALQVIPYICVNFGIPMISTWIIAYSIEKIFKPIIGWPLLLLIWYVISPFKNNLDSTLIILSQFVEEPHGNQSLVHYGLEMNMGLLSRKLWLLMFSMSGYIFVNLFSSGTTTFKNAKAKIAGVTAILLIIGSVPLAVVSSKPHSQGVIWNLNNRRWRGELLEQAKEKLESEYSNGQMKLLHLEIGDSKGDLLEYYAKINIDNVTKDSIIFTLYRSLDVIDLKVNGLEYSKYIRDGDWIILENNIEGEVEIEINVSGRLPYLLGEVTDRTMLLMPDFPWYPVLGKHKTILPVLTDDFLPNSLAREKPYEIIVKSYRGNIITNLSCDSGTEFNGQATGPAVIQGDYKSGNIEGIHFVAPPSIYDFYKESINKIPSLFIEYKRDFKDSLGIEESYCSYNKYNQVFLVNLSKSVCINQDAVYLNYSSWLSASPDIADDIRIRCESLRPIVLMECFWRTGLYMESSIAPALFHTMIEIAETGEKGDLEEYFIQWWEEDDEKQIVWENDLNDVYEIERLIKAESKEEISKIAYEILRKWVTVNNLGDSIDSLSSSFKSEE